MYVGQRLNKGGKCVRGADVGYILEYSNRAVAGFGECCLISFHLWGKHTFVDRNIDELHKNTHTAIVTHSTVRFSVSYPVSAVGSCPNKGALHSFIVLLSSISHTNVFFFPAEHFNPGKREWAPLLSLTQSGRPTTNQQSASLVDNAHKLKDDLK